MRRWCGTVTAVAVAAGAFACAAPPAQGAGIVTHAWMALDAIEHVDAGDLRALLDAHRDQVRAGAEFPDGGYWTRSLGTPGGDYGEEAHWQRFVDAYTDAIRTDPSCGDLTDPDGPCAPAVAHLMGVAAHGMGDEVWDWLFEPNGPGFREEYLPPDFTPFVGPGGLELQMDIVAIARHGRPTGPTPDLPDAGKIMAAFSAVGRDDIRADALPVGERYLEIERGAEAFWAPNHVDPLVRAMPWTSAHMVTGAGGVEFGAEAVAGYYETIWARLVGRPVRTRVTAVAPSPGARTVPATGWLGSYSPGSHAGNSAGTTRIAAALSSSLPYRAQAGQGSLPSELRRDAMRLRDLRTGRLVAARAGFPRIVPYNPEAGEHVVAFQPATDLQPCRWYQVDVTPALVDASGRSVVPAHWQFRTSGCVPRVHTAPVRGTVVCEAEGSLTFTPGHPATGAVTARLRGCTGGQDGTPSAGAGLPVATGMAAIELSYAGTGCGELTDPTGAATVSGSIRWRDAGGRSIGSSTIPTQRVDPRGGVVRVASGSEVFPDHDLALRVAPANGGCTSGSVPSILPIRSGTVTAWPD